MFYSTAGIKTVVSFDKAIVLDNAAPSTPAAPGEPTHSCDIYYYNPEDKELRVNGHIKLFSEVRVAIDNKLYRITPAYGAGKSNAFGEKWDLITTLVYKNSFDCHAKKSPIRIQIGLFESEIPAYTNRVDYNVGWESDSNGAFFFGSPRFLVGNIAS